MDHFDHGYGRKERLLEERESTRHCIISERGESSSSSRLSVNVQRSNDTRRSGIVFIDDRGTMSIACSSSRVNNVFPPDARHVRTSIEEFEFASSPIFHHRYFPYFCKLKSWFSHIRCGARARTSARWIILNLLFLFLSFSSRRSNAFKVVHFDTGWLRRNRSETRFPENRLGTEKAFPLVFPFVFRGERPSAV